MAELEARLASRAGAGMVPPVAVAPPAPATLAGSVAPPVPVVAPPVGALPPAQVIITRDGTAIRAIPLATLPEEPYSRTGCSRGFFAGSPPGKWKDPDAWDLLARGDTPARVEQLLGVEHYDVGTPAQRAWQYGKCNASVAGVVLFVGGRVDGWRTPENLR